jgi:hypothetical protein
LQGLATAIATPAAPRPSATSDSGSSSDSREASADELAAV